MSNKPQYLVLAQYLEGLDGIYPSLFDRRHLKVMGIYSPSDEAMQSPETIREDILRQFMDEYMSTPQDAQRFFPEVVVVEIGDAVTVDVTLLAKARCGELIKLPNPSRFTEVSYYFLRGDVE